jgi:hypothetical protein
MLLRFSVDDMENFPAPIMAREDPNDSWCMLVDATPDVLEQMLLAMYACCLEYLTIEAGGVSLEMGGDGDGPYVLLYRGQPASAAFVSSQELDATTAFDVFRRIAAGDPTWSSGLTFR